MATNTEELYAHGTEVIQLLPEDVVINSELTVRPGEEELGIDAALELLANSIKAEGQLQNAVVAEVPVGDEGEVEYHLIAGHRRLQAIQLINSTSEKQMRLTCTVMRDETESTIFRKALMENLHRKQSTPIQMALNIQRIRADNGWEGGANTSKVARFLCVSPAQVTQHEKLLTLDSEIQDKLSSGEMTAQQGFALLNVCPEKRKTVLDRAEILTESESTGAIAGPTGGQGASEAGLDVVDQAPPQTNGEGKKKRGRKSKYSTDALNQAIRETPDAEIEEKIKARSRKELVDWWDIFDTPAYTDQVRLFVRHFVDEYATGKAKSDRKLKRLFDMMVIQPSDEGLDILDPAEVSAGVSKAINGKSKGKKGKANAGEYAQA